MQLPHITEHVSSNVRIWEAKGYWYQQLHAVVARLAVRKLRHVQPVFKAFFVLVGKTRILLGVRELFVLPLGDPGRQLLLLLPWPQTTGAHTLDSAPHRQLLLLLPWPRGPKSQTRAN